VESASESKTAASLRACYREGIASQPVVHAIENYVVPFAMSLGAGLTQIGLLVAIPTLAGSLAYLASVRAVRYFGSRLQLLLDGMGAQIVLLALIGGLSFVASPPRFWILVMLVAGYRALNGLMGPAWGSLVSEYLPSHERPGFLARRARAVSVSGIGGLALWGALLWVLQTTLGISGFLPLFLAAALCRYMAMRFMRRMEDLPIHAETHTGSFWRFLWELRQHNVGRFVLYAILLAFAVNISGPYGSVRMLQELQFSYLGYMGVQVASVLATVLAVPLWGRYAGRCGAVRILRFTGPLVGFVPLAWMLGKHPAALMAIEVGSGFLWCGYELCVGTYLYDAVPAPNRMRVLAYFNVINGVAGFAGAALGGVLAKQVPPMLGSRLVSLFFVSAMLRFGVNGLFLQGFQETRAISRPRSAFAVLAHRLGSEGMAAMVALRVRLVWRDARRAVVRINRA
jgi:MFS family permease